MDSVEEMVKELNARGIATEPVRIDDYTGKKMTFFQDPDGLPLEYCRRSFQCEYGVIRVFWDQHFLHVSIPCGVSAVIRWKGILHDVGSGEYTFEGSHQEGGQDEGTRSHSIL